jgi:hypothetical protein
MKHSYFVSHDGYLYRRACDGKTSYWGKATKQWYASMYFSMSHTDIRSDAGHTRITRDKARKRFGSIAFKA